MASLKAIEHTLKVKDKEMFQYVTNFLEKLLIIGGLNSQFLIICGWQRMNQVDFAEWPCMIKIIQTN